MKDNENNKQEVRQRVTPKVLKNIGHKKVDSLRKIVF